MKANPAEAFDTIHEGLSRLSAPATEADPITRELVFSFERETLRRLRKLRLQLGIPYFRDERSAA